MSFLVSLRVLLIPCLCMHIAHAGARLLLHEEADGSADIMRMNNFDLSAGKAEDNIKPKLDDPNCVERTKMMLLGGNRCSPRTTRKAHEETKNKAVHESRTEHDDHREGYSGLPSTKRPVSLPQPQQPRKSGINKSSPGFFSDYSRPRMHPPSHNR